MLSHHEIKIMHSSVMQSNWVTPSMGGWVDKPTTFFIPPKFADLNTARTDRAESSYVKSIITSPISAFPTDTLTCSWCSERKRRHWLLIAASRNSSILMWMYLRTEYVCFPSLQPHNYKSADPQSAYERSLLWIITITLIRIVMGTQCKPGQETGTHDAFK